MAAAARHSTIYTIQVQVAAAVVRVRSDWFYSSFVRPMEIWWKKFQKLKISGVNVDAKSLPIVLRVARTSKVDSASSRLFPRRRRVLLFLLAEQRRAACMCALGELMS